MMMFGAYTSHPINHIYYLWLGIWFFVRRLVGQMTDEATPCSAFVLLLVVGTLAALHDSLDWMPSSPISVWVLGTLFTLWLSSFFSYARYCEVNILNFKPTYCIVYSINMQVVEGKPITKLLHSLSNIIIIQPNPSPSLLF